MRKYSIYHPCLVLVFQFFQTTFSIPDAAINAVGSRNSKVVICHIEVWSVYMPDSGRFTFDQIDPNLCTHVAIAYQHLNETTNEFNAFESWNELLGPNPKKTISKLKLLNPNIKILAVLGGWLDGSIKYSVLASNPKSVKRFVHNTVKFLRNNGLDGMELVWQYPAKRGGATRDKENYTHLLKALKTAFVKYDLTLTACVGSSKDSIDAGYDIPEISEILDYMLVYNFNYHGYWSRMTGANSGLIGPDFLNTEYSITYLLKLGANPNKLLLGVALYGRNFILNDTESFDANNPQFGQKFTGRGFKGDFTDEEGCLSYHEICLLTRNTTQNWTIFWDKESETPMAVDGDRMITFDNEESIKLKVQFALKHNLGGFSAYAINNDDFRGECGVKYPLLNAIKDELSTYRYDINEDNNIFIGKITNVSNSKPELSTLLLITLIVRFCYIF